MKKLLMVLLATSSAMAFADTFQDFNNNLYAQYSYTNTTVGSASAYSNIYGVGGTIQSKNNVWLNANAETANVNYNDQTSGNSGLMNIRAGYGFQFFGDNDSGFQVIPFVSFGTVDNANYHWGVGVQPEYRLLSSLKVSLGLGLSGYNGGTADNENTTLMAFNANPEVQYDINKTVMIALGYNYVSTFNGNPTGTDNTFTAKVGYLF